MNPELVRKNLTQFKLLQPRGSQDELWAFDYPIYTEDSKNEIRNTGNTYKERRQNLDHHH
jgi:hypothetical protein